MTSVITHPTNRIAALPSHPAQLVSSVIHAANDLRIRMTLACDRLKNFTSSQHGSDSAFLSVSPSPPTARRGILPRSFRTASSGHAPEPVPSSSLLSRLPPAPIVILQQAASIVGLGSDFKYHCESLAFHGVHSLARNVDPVFLEILATPEHGPRYHHADLLELCRMYCASLVSISIVFGLSGVVKLSDKLPGDFEKWSLGSRLEYLLPRRGVNGTCRYLRNRYPQPISTLPEIQDKLKHLNIDTVGGMMAWALEVVGYMPFAFLINGFVKEQGFDASYILSAFILGTATSLSAAYLSSVFPESKLTQMTLMRVSVFGFLNMVALMIGKGVMTSTLALGAQGALGLGAFLLLKKTSPLWMSMMGIEKDPNAD
jgi:hypothetical protein